MKLLITRHGQSEGNINKSVYFKMPDWSVPLTEKGKEQANLVGVEIYNNIIDSNDSYKCLLVYSSYTRAKQTTEIIEKQLTQPRLWIPPFTKFETPLIREREWGNLRNEYEACKNREERNHLFDFYRRPDGGESFADCHQRAFIFLNWLKTQAADTADTAVIVSHGEFIKTMLMIIDNVSVEDFDRIPNVKNCELIIRDIKN
jgi:broad specificity phosphatase PhoE